MLGGYILTAFLASLIIVPILSVPETWAMLYLWKWFVTPLFGMPVPSFWMLMGLLFVVS